MITFDHPINSLRQVKYFTDELTQVLEVKLTYLETLWASSANNNIIKAQRSYHVFQQATLVKLEKNKIKTRLGISFIQWY